ncbi:Eukaryotic translation initiation factor 3 subunit A [Psilocybe cubensis]|uniref:Eukaryotic translation initiation factor 3 subunit A n=2 Tax=Psilocybe cubensis TaxID=181762 RepID=A0ACB8GHM3_PSICU|nr:Eukaryotic translation initiation factor 3 subunit A [Psilocybe cubensis]KAH9475063.1 Eukaryotic translation initiation factor 3 subunit A [Psilocybe cubensis]
MAPFSKPETVLKQAEGLISVGQSHAALQSMTEMFSSKRFRSTPLTSLEPIMHRFIELCVDMRKGRTAKEGLMQYKNIAQNTSVQSIETVITRFVQLADQKVREAQEKAAVKSAVDIDDLEASETPESILLGAVSGDQNKDRTDRALVTPWLKFLWESYRTSLETLKNNMRLEAIYQQIAQQAFKFCLKHQRKVEFRRLCETLRLHLSNVAKYSHQQYSINLSDPETLQHHLDTRFAQLNTSVELELWQEAFRSVEDVHNLLTMAKKAPRPAMMANYYEKLTKIFLMSGNALYHAAAWSRYYAVVSSIGGVSNEEMGRLAAQVLVSALAVPVGLHTEEPDELKGKNARLTALLGLSRMPTRSGLLKDALARDILKLSPVSVKKLYNILEVTFDPLTLCATIAPLLQTLAGDEAFSLYLPLLQRALLSRLLSQLSQVYSTIKISNLLSLVAPLKDAGLEGSFDDEQVEAYIMGCARRGELSVRIDHKDGSITFVDDPFVTSDDQPTASTSTASTSTRESAIQPSTAELVRTRLSKVALCLHNTLEAIEEKPPAPTAEEQAARFRTLVAAVESERKALQLRRALVARRRELLSELSVRKEKEESSRRAESSRREKEEETRRAKEDLRRREQERTKKEIESIRIDEAKKYAQSLVDKGILKANEVDKLESFDTEGLITIQVAQLEKEKKELQERLRITSKRIDHIERAYRKEERSLLAQDYEQQQKTDKETFENIQKSRLEAAYRAHQEDLQTKARLSRMLGDYKERRQVVIEKKGEEFKRKLEAAQRKIAEEKEKRRKQVMKAREEEAKRQAALEEARAKKEAEEARLAAERAAEEERLRLEAEAAAARAEEEKRKLEAEAAARREAREKERQEAREKALLQQRREEEALARRAAQKAAPAPSAVPASVRAGAKDEPGVWRRSSATPTSSVPATPVRSSADAPAPPSRSESPAPGAAPAKYRPGALGGGGWRQREQEKAAGGGPTPPAAAAAAAPLAKEEPKKDEDGFQTVSSTRGGGVWRPRRGRA